MTTFQVTKHASDGRAPYSYDARLVERRDHWTAVEADWPMHRVDAGPISFEPGDILTEFFSTREYFNAFLVKRDGGKVAGWYCNITYPTQISGRDIHWHDLYLDIIIDHRGAIHIEDEDELEASGIRTSDADLYREILDARDRLLELIESAEYPFSYPDQ